MTDLIADLAEVVRLNDEAGWSISNGFNRMQDMHAAQNAAVNFIRAHAAEVGAMARDAEFGRAMKEAMNAEYTAAKQMRGRRQQEWITTYCLLRRLKSAAAHLSDDAMRSAKEDPHE